MLAVRMRCEDGGEESKGLRDYELFLFGFLADDSLEGRFVLIRGKAGTFTMILEKHRL